MFSPLDAELYVKLSPLTDADHRYVTRCRNNPVQRFKVSFNTQLSTIASYVLGRMAGQGLQHASNNSSGLNGVSNYNCNYNLNNGYGQSNSASMKVALSVQRLGSFVSVPLSITISELMMMASMNDEALLFYSFVQSSPRMPQNQANSFMDQVENYNTQTFPMPPQQQYQSLSMSPPSQMHSFSTSPASPPQIYSPSTMFSSPRIRNSPQQNCGTNRYYNSNAPSFSSPPVVRNQRYPSTNWSEVPTSPSCTLFHTGISMYTDSFGTMPPSFNFNQSNSNSFSNSYSSSLNDEEESVESIKLKQSLEAMIHRSSQVNSC